MVRSCTGRCPWTRRSVRIVPGCVKVTRYDIRLATAASRASRSWLSVIWTPELRRLLASPVRIFSTATASPIITTAMTMTSSTRLNPAACPLVWRIDSWTSYSGTLVNGSIVPTDLRIEARGDLFWVRRWGEAQRPSGEPDGKPITEVTWGILKPRIDACLGY